MGQRVMSPLRLFLCAAIVLGSACTPAKEKNMPEIRFDLNKNIADTAKRSGAPGFSVRNIQGLVSYGLVDLSPNVRITLTRPGHEVSVSHLFAFTMYADEDNKNNLAVTDIELQVASKVADTHETGQAFIESIISQFRAGRWKRYIDENCPLLTGRSSYLNEEGLIDNGGECGLDPSYHIPQKDWKDLFNLSNYYEWVGDNLFARLTISYSEDIRGLTYDIVLEFQTLDRKIVKDKERVAKRLADGDSKGYDSTQNYAKWIADRAIKNRKLEANALKRGDPLFIR